MQKVLIACLFFMFPLFGQEYSWHSSDPERDWIRATYNDMTLEERIGQLFMIRAFSNKGEAHKKHILDLIETHKIGGLCFFQGSPEKQARLTNTYQARSETPLLIAMDAEWGLGMRFKEKAISFPRQLTLGAIQDNGQIYEMGVDIARQLRRIGVHINFAPVVDVNNNPQNPVIGDRSFGEDRYNVVSKSYAYMLGMQDKGVMACAKHFPGHGDTDVDSHLDLPVITHDRQRLDSVELMPFKALAAHGVQAMMVAHLHVPTIDARHQRPTTLSNRAIDTLLKKEIGFAGIVFTDALDMKGVTKHFEQGIIELEAFRAGNDILVLSEAVKEGIAQIKKALESGAIPMQQLESSVYKILQAKYRLGLAKTTTVERLEAVVSDIHRPSSIALKTRLYEKAITMVRNEKALLPLKDLNGVAYGSLMVGASGLTSFQKRMSSYVPARHLSTDKEINKEQADRVVRELGKLDLVFVGFQNMSRYAHKRFGIQPAALDLLRRLQAKTRVVVLIFGSPYALQYFEDSPWVIQAYEEDPLMQDIAAQAVFGAAAFSGRLPVSVGPFSAGHGHQYPSLRRLGFASPESVGLDRDSLAMIDTIVLEMIQKKAAPGCQILVAKDGKIAYHKAFGRHTYDGGRPTSLNDVYDVASITKILASTLGVMKLQEEGQINILAPVRKYLSASDTSNKANLIIEDIMAHHAGLRGWIPFYTSTVEKQNGKSRPDSTYYRPTSSDSFSIHVANDLFLRSDYPDSIWQRIWSCSLRSKRDYRYSDLGFYILHEMVKETSGQPLDDYMQSVFYKPMGLRRTGFNPKDHISIQEIVPSEEDTYFRGQRVQGYVHDMGAAMLGGVSGHAGLFSNAYELANLMQMLLNGGYYGGLRYLRPETVERFTTRFYRSSRRGIGFDMKELDPEKKLNMSEKAPASTFGHLGFTGTCAFADPDNDIVYILLSNRTFPSMNNNVFGKDEFRPRIQSVIYRALMDDGE